MSEVISAVIRWVVPFILGGVVAGCVTYVRTIKRRTAAMEDGLQCLLRAEIIRSHEKYVERGYCPIYAKEALRREYQAYHALHGNDVATALYDECLELPVDAPANSQKKKEE